MVWRPFCKGSVQSAAIKLPWRLHPKLEGLAANPQWECHVAAVWGEMVTGGGAQPFGGDPWCITCTCNDEM